MNLPKLTRAIGSWMFLPVLLFLLAATPRTHAATMGIQEPAGYSARIDSPSGGIERIMDTATDGEGNVYVVGYYVSGAAGTTLSVFRDQADDSTGRPALSSQAPLLGSATAGFVVKYDRAGNVIWRRSIEGAEPGSGGSTISGVVVDGSGNLFVMGTFGRFQAQRFGGITLAVTARSNVDFNNTVPDSAVRTETNVFVAMLDRNGLWQWARQFDFAMFRSTNASAANLGAELSNVTVGILPDTRSTFTSVVPPTDDPQGRALAIDDDGSLYLKLRFGGGTFPFGPTPNSVYWLRSEGAGRIACGSTNAGGTVTTYGGTTFMAKLAATPPPFNAPAGTPTTYDWRWIAPVNSGVTTTGDTIDSVLTTAPYGSISGFAVNDGSLYLTGTWSGTLVGGGSARAATTSRDGYVMRWRANDATPLYLATMVNNTAGSGTSRGGALATGENGNIYVTGACAGSTTLKLTSADASTSTLNLGALNATQTNCFVAKLDASGQWVWSEAPSLTGFSAAGFAANLGSLARDSAGALYLGGSLTSEQGIGSISFGPGATSRINASPYGGAAEAFVVKLSESATGIRTWRWALQTNVQPTGAIDPIYDTGDLAAGFGGTIFWALNGASSPGAAGQTRFTNSRSPNSADRDFDTINGQGAFLLPILADSPALSAQFNLTTTIPCGSEVLPPEGVFLDVNGRPLQPETTLPASNNANGAGHFYWDTFEKKLFAVSPALADIHWKVNDSPISTARLSRRVTTAWPTPAQGLITQVTGAGSNGDEPRVSLEPPTINHTFSTILYQDNLSTVAGAKQLATRGAGYSVLLYTVGKNTAAGSAPVNLEVVRSYLWAEPEVNSTATASIGSEISGATFNHADPSGKNGYIVNAKARFDGTGPGAAYDRATQLGSIIPVNTDEPGPDDDMVIIWSGVNPRGVAWPRTTVTYTCSWPGGTVIAVASQLGSEVLPTHERLDPAKFQAMSIYHQPDKNLAGYNPNEEHALLAPSNGLSAFQAVFPLRTDLNNLGRTTSQRYTLLRYQDATDGLKTKFKVYRVVAEILPDFTFANSFIGTAGTRVQPPYPLVLLGDAPGTTGSGTAYFKDRKNQVWARSAGTLVGNYYYPLQPNFWYDTNGDGIQDADTQAPWMDRHAGTIGTPIAINYTISWPASAPTLAVGDTLTSARNGLPDVENHASSTVIYEEANPALDPLLGSVRFIDYTSERAVPLNGVVNGQNFVLGTLALPVELTAGGRYRFRDLPFHLKSRLSFDPINKLLIFGGYKNSDGAGVPLVLVNVLSTNERDRLLTFDGAPSNAAWDGAIEGLYLASRNPNGVDLDNNNQPDSGYYVGLKEGTGNNLTYADALGPKALTAGKATGLGYVTLVENNADGLGAAPIALHILRVINPPVVGELKIIFSDNALDEKVTLRHANDFAGDPDGLFFEWYYQPAITPTSPIAPDPVNPGSNGWISLARGFGVNDVVIEGAGLATLADSWVFCRYRGYTAGGFDPNAFTDWAGDPSSTPHDRRAAFVPGWIKRVLEGLNPFEARVRDFGSAPTQTYSSFVAQAGARYEGAVALSSDPANLNNLGLISLYETVLRRGLGLSINGTPPQTNDAVNTALLLAATRVSDFYMLLGNEAYADAQDPTIGFTSASGEVGTLAPSVYSFANQLPSLISEELCLLRGRDNSSAGTGAAPVYNRLFWNFTGGLEGEPVYVQNYGITDQNVDGFISEIDAKFLFPQGHGDAWGHYLSAVKSAYRLLRHPLFQWTPRSESTLVAGVAIEVDYVDERKFANAAAARAGAGAEIVNLTYRDRYVADPAGQWQGYRDTDTQRAWGLDEWARRAGQGAYFDWLTANALLPAVHTAPLQNPGGPPPSGLQKIDRTTVVELEKIGAAFASVQAQMDRADQGLNPLGVAPGSITFDINPSLLANEFGNQSHFDQVISRTLAAVNGARQVFDFANTLTQRLRQTQISADQFATDTLQQERDYRSRLIEIFGYPYAGDIGSGKTYPTGYNGPDIYHYNYVAVNEASGETLMPDTAIRGFFAPFGQQYVTPAGGPQQPSDITQVVQHYFSDDVIDPSASATAALEVDFPISTAARWSFVAPASWGQRRAQGTLQMAIADMVRAEAELRRGLVTYNNHVAGIQDQLDLLQARFNLQATQINVLNGQRGEIQSLNDDIQSKLNVSRKMAISANAIGSIANAAATAIPQEIGTSFDAFSIARGVVLSVAVAIVTPLEAAGAVAAGAADAFDRSKEDVGLRTEIEIQKNDYAYEVREALKAIEALLREEVGLRLDLFNLQEALQASSANYATILAQGQELMETRKIARQLTAGSVQQNRYQDLTFRVFRNDALQKYRAAFDLAARYTYLAATTYDYETCQLGGRTTAGRRFLTDIVRERALGQFNGDAPVAGVNGLSDPLARLVQNFQVLKGQLGLNSPQIETGRFSLRKELYRLRDGSDVAWRDQLQKLRVANLWSVPEFRRFCRPFAPESAGPQPGLVIPFSTDITFGQNYFGLPLGGGDSSYDSANFATKINSTGVWFENYNGKGLSNTPRVYLVPVGLDVMRAPDDLNLSTREFDVIDQSIPVPFPIGVSDLNNPSWIPTNDNLDSPMGEIRRFNRFRAYHDNGFQLSDLTRDTRLVGRSVWNTKWLLIIPGGTLLNDPNEGLNTFILGERLPGSEARDGAGIEDIKLFFETYGYSGN